MLIRPPQRWREVLINPEFLGDVFRTYATVGVGRGGVGDPPRSPTAGDKRGRLVLLLQLSSVADGPIFLDDNERGAYAVFLLERCLNKMEPILNHEKQRQQQQQSESITDDEHWARRSSTSSPSSPT